MKSRTEREPIIKTCEGCGKEYEAKTVRSKRCKKNCGRKDVRKGPRASKHAARTQRRKEGGLFFIGFDGEGVTREETFEEWEEIDGEMVEVPTTLGVHYYDMLSVGDHTYVTPDGGQIHYDDALHHIWDSTEEYRKEGHERICLVGYFLGYDYIQIFRTLPEKAAWKLFSKEGQDARRSLQKKNGWKRIPKVRVGPWKLDMLAGKRLTIQHVDHPGVSITICDVGAFFQTSFLVAIDPSDWIDPICTAEEFEIIKRGKEARGGMMTLDEQLAARAETIEYNRTENAVLAKLMTRLDQGFRENGIDLRADQFYGPGQAAQKWMSNIGAPTTEELQDVLSPKLFRIFQGSYYGGWFEIFCHGHIPGVTWEYDITSAYPDIIRSLPCLLCGQWKPDHEGTLRIARYHVLAPVDAVTGPLPHRKRDGSILRPRETRGYHWADEVEAAERAGLVAEYVEVTDKWSFHPSDCRHDKPKPYQEIEDLFLQRIKVNKKSPAGKALKLVYNSAYGKMAQSVGMPKFASPIYASLITSGCRTKILNAIASHPEGARALTMVATDAVFFRSHIAGSYERVCALNEELDRGEISKNDYGQTIAAMAQAEHPSLDMRENTLGAWEGEPKLNLTQFMPGVYWDDKSRKAIREGSKLSLKSRGISARELSNCIEELDRQFDVWGGEAFAVTLDENREINEVEKNLWPRLTMYSDFGIVSLSQALARGKWGLAGRLMVYEDDKGTVQTGVKRTITADASPKRYPGALYVNNQVIEMNKIMQMMDESEILHLVKLDKVDDVWRTTPYPAVTIDEMKIIDTVPYDKSFGHELMDNNIFDTIATPDGGDPLGNMVRILNGSA